MIRQYTKTMWILVAISMSSSAAPVGVRAESRDASGAYAAVLREFVDDRGRVDYSALKANRDQLDAYAASLAVIRRKSYEEWNKPSKIAFWINAYNGLTLKLIIDHYPIKASRLKSLVYPKNSIRQIPGAWDKIEFEVMGEKMTLNEIEHEVLRANFDEPRIHMALVCAAVSCPVLRNEPYDGENLETQLDDQTRRFLADTNKFKVDRGARVVWLSAIFDWFAGDFFDRYGSSKGDSGLSERDQAVINFVSRYVAEKDKEFLAAGDYDVKHFDYDWTLNEKNH